MRKVTDPNILKQLDSKLVTDPEILQRLESKQPRGVTKSFIEPFPWEDPLYYTEDYLKRVGGLGEAITSALTGTVGNLAGGLTTVGSMPFVGPEKAAQLQQEVAKTLTYTPEFFPKEAQNYLQPITKPFEWWSKGADVLADIGYDISGSPLVGAGIKTGMEAVPYLLPLKGPKKLSPGKQAALKLMEEGYPITGGGGKTRGLLQGMAEKIPPGRAFFQKQRGKLNDTIIQANRQYSTEVLGLPSLELQPKIKAAKEAAFNKFVETAGGKDALMEAPNLKKFIETNLDAFYFSKNKQMPKALSVIENDLSKSGTTSFGKVNNIASHLRDIYKDPQTRRLYGELTESIKSDFGLFQEKTGKPILDDFNIAMDKARMMHRFTETRLIDGLFKKATKFNENVNQQVFYPKEFRRLVDEKMPLLEEMFKKNPEIPKNISQYADELLVTAKDIQKYTQYKPLGASELFQTGAGGIGLGFLTGSKELILPAWVGETAMAYALAHPRGWMKFKKIIPKEAIKKAAPIGALMKEEE